MNLGIKKIQLYSINTDTTNFLHDLNFSCKQIIQIPYQTTHPNTLQV